MVWGSYGATFKREWATSASLKWLLTSNSSYEDPLEWRSGTFFDKSANLAVDLVKNSETKFKRVSRGLLKTWRMSSLSSSSEKVCLDRTGVGYVSPMYFEWLSSSISMRGELIPFWFFWLDPLKSIVLWGPEKFRVKGSQLLTRVRMQTDKLWIVWSSALGPPGVSFLIVTPWRCFM